MDSGFSVQNKETGGGEGGVIQNSELRIKSDGFRIQN